MTETNHQEKLILEEQNILNNLIDQMDEEMEALDSRLTRLVLEKQRIKDKCLPDTYGQLIDTNERITQVKTSYSNIQLSRDELYHDRMKLEYTMDTGESGIDELKVGLHTYCHKDKIYVCSWKRPVCRHYILNNSEEDFVGVIKGKNGRKYTTNYKLNMRRKVDLHFMTVKNVTQLYPIMTEEDEDIIADEFLKELARRRNESEFKNIVFSIQKRQGEIIQSPYRQNMIVQGCAGSGKSMIMLHRLPIILYDNPNSLVRSNLYIITPSLTYIQMADSMRKQLEISDLKMGTIKQYYDYVISKYLNSYGGYGKINFSLHLTQEMQQYIYSMEFMKDVDSRMNQMIANTDFDLSKANRILEVKQQNSNPRNRQELLNKQIADMQVIITKNENALKSNFDKIKEFINQWERMANDCSNAQLNAARKLKKKLNDILEENTRLNKEIQILDPVKNEKAIKNRLLQVEYNENQIEILKEKISTVISDDEYFSDFQEIGSGINEFLSMAPKVNNRFENNSISRIYEFLAWEKKLITYTEIYLELLDEKEAKYIELEEQLDESRTNLKKRFKIFCTTGKEYLQQSHYDSIYQNLRQKTKLRDNIVQYIYSEVMKKVGKGQTDGRKLEAIEDSPFIYLCILHAYLGSPNATKESLITIDEAQNLSPVEIKLIKEVNDNKVIFNLFGDERQHVEGTKGISHWSELEEIEHFETYHMRENYRNARQITEYCNEKFHMNMIPINLDGQGVHEIKNIEIFNQELCHIFSNRQPTGLSAIIVKSTKEVNDFLSYFKFFSVKLHDLSLNNYSIHRSRWNIMTVDEAKGLEFNNVIAITGSMTLNEKYITYTRALNELWVYDDVILPYSETEPQKKDSQPEQQNLQAKPRRKRREKPSELKKKEKYISDSKTDDTEISVKEFFEKAGLETVDKRKENGYLWVLGDKDSIGTIVNEAIERYNLTGVYSAGKATGYRQGWFTKTKK